MRARVIVACMLAALAFPGAVSAQSGADVVVGGAPGVHVSIDGIDVESAGSPGGAIAFDPSSAANVTLALSPPANTTWEIRSFTVGLVVNGLGSAPPAALSRAAETNTTIPPGFTVFINRTVDLAAFRSLGAGLFLMQVSVEDQDGSLLYSQQFYVHVQGNVLFTVAGATVTVLSVGTGYGLWQIVRDVREFLKARERHKKHEETRRGRAAALGALGGAALELSDGLGGLLSVAGDADKRATRLEKRKPLAWTATGLGLGGVGVAWAQFLGLLPLDLGRLLVVTLSVGAVFLTASLLLVAWLHRARARLATRTLVPEGAPETAEQLRARP